MLQSAYAPNAQQYGSKPMQMGAYSSAPRPMSPGQAQPVQQQSRGTPYGSLMAPQPYQQPGGAYGSYGQQPYGQQSYGPQSYGQGFQRLSPYVTLAPPGVYPNYQSSQPPAPPQGDTASPPQSGRTPIEGDYQGWKRQQVAQQSQANYDTLMQYRQQYPGMSDDQLRKAMATDRSRREQQSQDDWTMNYGTDDEKQALAMRRQWQQEKDEFQAKHKNFGLTDPNEQRAWKYDPSQPGGVKYLDKPQQGGPARSTQPSYTPGQGPGNLAYADQRPDPFTQSMNFMGQPMDPGQYYGQRDAFIQNINNARQSFAQNPTDQGQRMNFGNLWGQAGNMVQNGWQSPLSGLMGGAGGGIVSGPTFNLTDAQMAQENAALKASGRGNGMMRYYRDSDGQVRMAL